MDNRDSVQYNIGQLYRAVKRELAALSDIWPGEAMLLCEHFLGVSDRAELLVRSEEAVSAEKAKALLDAAAQRAHRPLQYILGEWHFDGMMLRVGEGVLVPREDTLTLVELACEKLSGMGLLKHPSQREGGRFVTLPQSPAATAPSGRGPLKPISEREGILQGSGGGSLGAACRAPLRILDLCAGTGAVGLAVARRLPDAQVICVELSEEAWPYLTANIEQHGDGRVTALRGDVLAGPEALGIAPGSFDAILSNPPYIPAGDIPGLAREVRQEPVMALDGGEDGLVFYRAIASLWKDALRGGGLVCMEHGEGQFEDIKRIIVRCGWSDIGYKLDFSGKIRAINGTKM